MGVVICTLNGYSVNLDLYFGILFTYGRQLEYYNTNVEC